MFSHFLFIGVIAIYLWDIIKHKIQTIILFYFFLSRMFIGFLRKLRVFADYISAYLVIQFDWNLVYFVYDIPLFTRPAFWYILFMYVDT